jgi:Holliday junction DNA helicase RuvB subunit
MATKGLFCDNADMHCPYCGHTLNGQESVCPQCNTALSLSRLPVGTTLSGGRYTVGRVLGQGGFGITYQGSDTQLRRVVAIKELFPDGSSRRNAHVIAPGSLGLHGFAAARAGFLSEARTLAQFDHPGIVRVWDAFEENGTAYLVMEKLVGETLGTRLDRDERLPAAETERIALILAEALEVIHSAGLLHRDLKPDNIFISTDGRAVLIDFGSAREFVTARTVRHTRLLTPGYAPLEQYAEQARFGPYTDIYALGATLYHALMGNPPPAVTDRMLGVPLEPLPLTVPPGLRQGINQALELHIEKRPQSVRDFTDLTRNLITLGLHPTVRDLSAFVGQDKARLEMRGLLDKQRVSHTLLVGPAESGRRTFAQAVAAELGGGILIRHANTLKTPQDLAQVFENFRDGDMLFIEDIHRLGQLISERLYSLLRGAKLDLVSGSGGSMYWTQITVPGFKLFASTDYPNLVHKTLRSSFETILHFGYYTAAQLIKLILAEARAAAVKLDDDAALEVARRSRGQLRNAKILLRRVTDAAVANAEDSLTQVRAIETLEAMGLDVRGLDTDDLRLLEKLMLDFGGGPAPVGALAAAIGKEQHMVQENHEPYLTHIGFVRVANNQWTLQDAAYHHLTEPRYDEIELEF